MGSVLLSNDESYEDESPQHSVYLDEFYITATPITNYQYSIFTQATNYRPPIHWETSLPSKEQLNHPVTYIDWNDALAFCHWSGVELPSEAQWEKSARGIDGRNFPWGNSAPDEERANFGNMEGKTTKVQQTVKGSSPYGVYDLVGNVWEWTRSIFSPYPYNAEDGREKISHWGPRAVRGGNFLSTPRNIRCADRNYLFTSARDLYLGFRVITKKIETLPTIDGLHLEWKQVPAREFIMGNNFNSSNREELLRLFASSKHSGNFAADFDNELPAHEQYLPSFRISQHPITNSQYEEFTKATRHKAPSHWPNGKVSEALKNHPVVYVDWDDAEAFCRWAKVRLPTEPEWERAARSMDGRIWPWGNELPDSRRANFGQVGKSGFTLDVNALPLGASAEGVLGMAGNVWEMCASIYRPYPYEANDGREDFSPTQLYVLRGGSFASPHAGYLRTTTRSMSYRSRRRDHIGFRVVAEV